MDGWFPDVGSVLAGGSQDGSRPPSQPGSQRGARPAGRGASPDLSIPGGGNDIAGVHAVMLSHG